MVPFLCRRVESCIPYAVAAAGVGAKFQKGFHTFDATVQRRKKAAKPNGDCSAASYSVRVNRGSQRWAAAVVRQIHIRATLNLLSDFLVVTFVDEYQ